MAKEPVGCPYGQRATALSYEDASMDAAVLTAVLGEIPDPTAALREIRLTAD